MSVSSITLDSLTTFGDLLRHLRRRVRLTQREFGIAVGYSEAHVGRLESNERRPEVATVGTRFVEALDLEHEPQMTARLIELAKLAHAAARSQGVVGVTARPRLTNLPAPLTHFVGREGELAEVAKLIRDHRLVTLSGVGGIGKTRLAVEVGSRLLEEFKDGVWWIELASVSDPALVSGIAVATLKLSESGNRPHLDALADHLETRQALLVLDNCEHLIEASATLVESLLRRCPNLHVLATSRETLRVMSEATYVVSSLKTPDSRHGRIAPECAMDYAAVQLFVDRVRVADLKFTLSNQNIESVTRVCQHLDGIPLALELAAGLARAMTVGEIAARLEEQRLLPESGYRGADPRHGTMRRALDWSYQLLAPAEQLLLAQLTVFTGGWTAEAAEAVCGETDVQVLTLLNQLVHKSLVMSTQHHETTHYWLLEPIRQYADEKLHELGAWQSMRDRHLSYFVRFAACAELGLMGNAHGAWLKRLGPDYDNLLAALTWSQDHPETSDAYTCIAVSLWRYWAHRREYREGATWMEGAVQRSATYPAHQRVKVLAGATISVAISGNLGRAAELAEECLILSREIADCHGEGCALMVLAWWADVHDPTRAVPLHEESARALRQTPDLWLTANELRFLGGALFDQDLDRAAGFIQEALDMWQKMGSMHGVCTALGNLGDVALRRGQHDLAYAYFEQSIRLASEIGYPELTSIYLERLTRADRERSIAFCEQRLAELREAGNTKEIAVTLHAIGQMVLDAGDLKRADSLFEECLSHWQQLGAGATKAPNIAWAWIEWGHVARYQGKLHLAAARYEEGLRANQAASGIYGIEWVQVYLGYVRLLQGNLIAATVYLQKSLHACLSSIDSGVILGAIALAAMSDLARVKGQMRQSMQLAGAAAVLLPDDVRAEMRPIERLDYERVIVAARAQLDHLDYAAAWAEGAAMPLNQAVKCALGK